MAWPPLECGCLPLASRRRLRVLASVETRVQACKSGPTVEAVQWHARQARKVGCLPSLVGWNTAKVCPGPTPCASLPSPSQLLGSGGCLLVWRPQSRHLAPPAGQGAQSWSLGPAALAGCNPAHAMGSASCAAELAALAVLLPVPLAAGASLSAVAALGVLLLWGRVGIPSALAGYNPARAVGSVAGPFSSAASAAVLRSASLPLPLCPPSGCSSSCHPAAACRLHLVLEAGACPAAC